MVNAPPRAGDGVRTHDNDVGNVVLYQLSYTRNIAAGGRRPGLRPGANPEIIGSRRRGSSAISPRFFKKGTAELPLHPTPGLFQAVTCQLPPLLLYITMDRSMRGTTIGGFESVFGIVSHRSRGAMEARLTVVSGKTNKKTIALTPPPKSVAAEMLISRFPIP